MWNPKPTRYKSQKYLGFIKLLPCEVANRECMGQIIPHHVEAGGVGTKCHDTFTIPLCVFHHAETHRGAKSFLEKYNIDLWRTIAKLITRFLIEAQDG